MNHPNLPTFSAPGGRFGNEIEVHMNRNLPDGQVILYGSRYLWIGTHPLPPREQRRRANRLYVRELMADVLAQLGHPVNIFPTGQEILRAIRDQGENPYDTLRRVNRQW